MTLLIAGCFGISGGTLTLEGQFVWSHGNGETKGDLVAFFTPTGKDEWSVAFHLDWEGEAQVYTGTARGSLTDGTLEGQVDDTRTYRFSGTVEDGEFAGTHARVSPEGETRELGTLTLGSSD